MSSKQQYVSAPASDGQVQITAPRALSAEDVQGIHWVVDHLLIVQGHRRPWESDVREEAGAESDSARDGGGAGE